MIPDSILSALDHLIAGGTPTPIPDEGLDADCQVVVGRINQLIARLRQEEVNSRMLLEGETLPTIISRLDDGLILFANRRARAFFCIEDADLGVRRAEDLWMKPELRQAFVERICRDGRVDDFEVEYRRRDGSAFYGLLSANHISFQGEEAVLSSFLSIHERRLAEQALQKSHMLLDEVGELARIGGWELDLESNTLTWSRQVREIHEVGTDYQPDTAAAIAFYAPEAVPAITLAMQRATREGRPFDLELPLVTARGKAIWVRSIGRAFFEGGKAVRLSGVFQDITGKKKLEAERETLLASLKDALDSVKTLRGLLPICAGCKKIRDGAGYWSQLESYFSLHGDISFTHGLCPECAKTYFPKQGTP